MTDLNKRIHDIRKPLNNISMQAELIKMLAELGDNQEKINLSAEKIIHNAKQCSEMLQILFEDVSLPTANTDTSKKSV